MKAIAFLSLLAASAFGQLPETVYLLKPVSVMSDSGISRFEALKFYRVVKEDGDNYVLENDRKVQFIAAKSDVTADAELIAPAATPAPVARVVSVEPAQIQTVSNSAPQEDLAKKSRLERRRALLTAAEIEKRKVEAARKDSVRRGNSPDSIENRQRKERIFALRLAIYDIKKELGMPAGARPQ